MATRILTLSLLFTFALQADWPQWRGPKRDGRILLEDRFPQSLDAVQTLWSLGVGAGFASPVVSGGKLFYFDNQDEQEVLHAIDPVTKKELWRESIDSTFKDQQGPSGPRCTPLVDADRVYAVSCRGELQCRNLTTGKLLWRSRYSEDFNAQFIGEKGNIPGAARHGNNGSPVIDGPHLIACVGGTNGAGIVCFDKKNGAVIWKSQNDQAAYAPPIVASIAGVQQVICFMAEAALGLDRSNGKLLWRVPIKTAFARHVSTPVVVEDIVILGSHQSGLMGIRFQPDGAGIRAEQAWVNKDAAVNFSSPVAVDGHVFGLGPGKDVFCLEAATGKIKWSQPGYFLTSADKAHASFLVAGKNILMLTDGGELVLFAAESSKFTERGRTQVCGANWCNPAYANGKLFIRDGLKGPGELRCIDLFAKSNETGK